jgi:chemosensory pili system protein ChpC
VSSPIRCMLLPLAASPLLLPAAVVAEIAPLQELELPPAAPAWLRGTLAWRGLTLPIVSLEAAGGMAPPQPDAHSRIAVLNGLGGSPHAFIGALIAGTPRLLEVTEDQLESVSEEAQPGDGAVLRPVLLAGASAMIADLVALERMLSAWEQTQPRPDAPVA